MSKTEFTEQKALLFLQMAKDYSDRGRDERAKYIVKKYFHLVNFMSQTGKKYKRTPNYDLILKYFERRGFWKNEKEGKKGRTRNQENKRCPLCYRKWRKNWLENISWLRSSKTRKEKMNTGNFPWKSLERIQVVFRGKFLK